MAHLQTATTNQPLKTLSIQPHHQHQPTLTITSFMKSYSKRLSCSCSTGGKPSNSTPLRASCARAKGQGGVRQRLAGRQPAPASCRPALVEAPHRRAAPAQRHPLLPPPVTAHLHAVLLRIVLVVALQHLHLLWKRDGQRVRMRCRSGGWQAGRGGVALQSSGSRCTPRPLGRGARHVDRSTSQYLSNEAYTSLQPLTSSCGGQVGGCVGADDGKASTGARPAQLPRCQRWPCHPADAQPPRRRPARRPAIPSWPRLQVHERLLAGRLVVDVDALQVVERVPLKQLAHHTLHARALQAPGGAREHAGVSRARWGPHGWGLPGGAGGREPSRWARARPATPAPPPPPLYHPNPPPSSSPPAGRTGCGSAPAAMHGPCL